jgi:pilus assembly protein CpaD
MKGNAMKYLAQSIRGSALCAALLLAGCMNDSAAVRSPEFAFLPPERYPIPVEAQMAVYQIPLNAARNDVDARGENDLRQIAVDYLSNGSGSIALSASGNDRNVTGRVSDRLVVLGVPADRIMITADSGPQSGPQARVSFVRYHADPPPCGNWSESLAITYENKPSPNFGCATQHNLAVEVADPHDLVAPKTLEPGDALRSLTVLDKYRQGAPTVAQKSQAQSGAVSQAVGK